MESLRPCVSGLCVLFLLLGPATFMGDVVGAGSLVSQSVLILHGVFEAVCQRPVCLVHSCPASSASQHGGRSTDQQGHR